MDDVKIENEKSKFGTYVAPVITFLKSRTAYDAMPVSSKIIIFDIDLPVKEAFVVAAENSIICFLLLLMTQCRNEFCNPLGFKKKRTCWNVDSYRFDRCFVTLSQKFKSCQRAH